MLYILTEDSKSGYQLWNFINENVLHNIAKVEQRHNVSELRKYVCKLTPKVDDIYIIAMDYVFDNAMVMHNYDEVLEQVKQYSNNIFMLDIISTEYILLTYSNLIDNVTKQGKLVDNTVIKARQTLLNAISNNIYIDYKNMRNLIDYANQRQKDIQSYTIEQIVTSILKQITKNTGYTTEKKVFEGCWVEDCCNINKYPDCQLNKSAEDKALDLYNNSEIKVAIQNLRQRGVII